MTAAYHHTGVFSIKNPTIESEVSWSSLLSFYTLEEQSFQHCESEDLEWFWMKEWSLISCQVFSDLNPVEDEWGELKRRSCESEDLEWFWMKEWSLISCQVFSDLIRHYNKLFRAVKLAKWCFKKYWKKVAVNCGQCVLEKNMYFIMICTPILNSYYPMKDYIFFILFFIKDEKD